MSRFTSELDAISDMIAVQERTNELLRSILALNAIAFRTNNEIYFRGSLITEETYTSTNEILEQVKESL